LLELQTVLGASVLFFISGFLAIALGIGGAPVLVSFETGLRLFFLALTLSIATFLAAELK
jgi:hypothetical protein